ncbi:hypothetical protein [Abiotrophia defectiva]|jgi:hypothetical protein|uniref:hypothetical protein n=1 Tax=Abiotrophia defectiva TaxID=46125 RepID=UPI0028ED5DFB|nr:hypothetical protein [Abiotrophia defectiva]
MAKIKCVKTLSEVLEQPTVEKEFVSEKTGNSYKTDVVERFLAVSVGSIEEVDDGFKYSVVDTLKNLELEVKAPNKVDVRFGLKLEFSELRGGPLNSGYGWYKASAVKVVGDNEK